MALEFDWDEIEKHFIIVENIVSTNSSNLDKSFKYTQRSYTRDEAIGELNQAINHVKKKTQLRILCSPSNNAYTSSTYRNGRVKELIYNVDERNLVWSQLKIHLK